MRTVKDIHRELEFATAKRAELWAQLGREREAAKAAEAARLTAEIDDLWAELRSARVRERHGSPDFIIRQARRDQRIERELERRALADGRRAA